MKHLEAKFFSDGGPGTKSYKSGVRSSIGCHFHGICCPLKQSDTEWNPQCWLWNSVSICLWAADPTHGPERVPEKRVEKQMSGVRSSLSVCLLLQVGGTQTLSEASEWTGMLVGSSTGGHTEDVLSDGRKMQRADGWSEACQHVEVFIITAPDGRYTHCQQPTKMVCE